MPLGAFRALSRAAQRRQARARRELLTAVRLGAWADAKALRQALAEPADD